MAKRSARKRRRIDPANSHTPDPTPTSINGCEAKDCAELGLYKVDLAGVGVTYLCDTHFRYAQREERRQGVVQAIRNWEAQQPVTEPPSALTAIERQVGGTGRLQRIDPRFGERIPQRKEAA